MTFQALLESDACVRLGWTLLHSLWQLAIIGALAATTIACLRWRTHARYAVAYLALLLMAVAPVATYFVVTPPATSLEVADVASETPPIALVPPEPRVRLVEPSVVEMEVDVARNGSPLSPAPLEMSELPSESETLAPPPIEVVDLSPAPEPEPTPTTQRANEPAPPSLAQRAARASAWLAPFWLAGVIFLALRHLGGWALSRRLLCTAAPLEHIELHRRLEGLMQKMGVRRAVRLLQSTLADAPMVLGVMRPALIAPVSLVTGLSPTQWEAILAHELAHIRRYDYLMNVVQIVIETLLFYHPAAWWLSRCIRAERENCCDDIAAEYCGSPVALAEGLAAIEAVRLKNGATGLAVAAVGPGSQDSTLRRVRRILGFSDLNPKRDRTWLAGFLVLTLLLLIAGVVGHRAGTQVDGSPQDTRAEGESESTSPTQRTIPFELNMEFPLDITSEADEAQTSAHLSSIIIREEGDKLCADVKASFLSHPKCKWGVAIEEISEDEDIRPIYWADHVFENSGRIIGKASRETADLPIPLGLAKNLADASELRISIRPIPIINGTQTVPLELGAMLPLEIESGAFGHEGVAQLAWVRTKYEDARWKVTARLLLLSAPKGKWRVTTELLYEDDRAKPLRVDRAVFENSGVILGQPLLGNRDLRFSFRTTHPLDQATRLRITIEQAPTNAETTVHMQGDWEMPLAYRVRRATTERFLQALFAKQEFSEVAKVTGLSWPKEYMDIAGSFSSRAGRFERVLSCRMCQAEGGQYMEARCRWEKAVMLVRLTFDEEGEEVTGFWLARDKEGPTPKGFKRGGYIIGRSMMEVAGLGKTDYNNLNSLTLHVKLADEDGRLLRLHVYTRLLKRRTAPDTSSDSIEEFNGERWTSISRMRGAEYTFDGLSPGIYRLRSNFREAEPTWSEPIHLDGAKPKLDFTFTIPDRERVSCRFEAKLIDTASGHEITGFEPGFSIKKGDPPPAYSPSRSMIYMGEASPHDCALVPGKYYVRICGAWHTIGDHLRVSGEQPAYSFMVTEEGPNEFHFDIALQGFAEKDPEVARRWPCVVQGVVRDVNGSPISGANVYINENDVDIYGKQPTREALAWATTDNEGRYSVRFALRHYTATSSAARRFHDGRASLLANANVRVTVDKPGYIVTNPAEHGRFWFVKEEVPLDKNGKPLAPDVITTPDRPFQDIDFTLTLTESEPVEIKTTDPEQESSDLSYAERARRAMTYRFLEALFANQSMSEVRKLTGVSWPRSYVDIANSFAQRAGPFERALSYHMVRTEDGDYMEARCKWERAVMLVRLSFVWNNRFVTGFWLARDKQGPTPKGFKRGGYIFGKPMMKIAGLDETAYSNIHNLPAHVTLVDENGRPKDPPLRTMLWKRTLDPNAHAYSSADLIEDMDGVGWQYVSEMRSADHTFSDLSAGVYRLTANYLGTRTVVSDAFGVTGSPAQADIPFVIPDSQRAACRISARLIDKGSNEPLERFQPLFKIYRSGFPRVSSRYDNKYDNTTREEGYACELLPGVYQVDVCGAWHSIGARSRALARPTRFSFEVIKDGPNEFTFDLPLHRFAEADEEVATRWPNVVGGIVRTTDGEPVEGSDVHVHGRPEERAWTTTDADGRFSLRFAPRYYTTANTAADLFKRGQLDVRANAIVHVELPGFVDANLARQGRFTVVDEAPLDKDGNPLAPERIAVRGEPFRDINFTMVPAARIYANFFRDQDGRPMDRQLVLANADDPELRLYEQDSAVDHFEGVPTVGRWRFHTYHEPSGPHFDSSLSPVMSFSAPGSYHAYLQAVEIPEAERSHPNKSLRIKLLSLIDPGGQEIAPSPETHIMVGGEREPLHSPVRIGKNREEN